MKLLTAEKALIGLCRLIVMAYAVEKLQELWDILNMYPNHSSGKLILLVVIFILLIPICLFLFYVNSITDYLSKRRRRKGEDKMSKYKDKGIFESKVYSLMMIYLLLFCFHSMFDELLGELFKDSNQNMTIIICNSIYLLIAIPFSLPSLYSLFKNNIFDTKKKLL